MLSISTVLSASAFWVLNKTLTKHLGCANASLILAELIAKHEYHATREELTLRDDKQWFVCTQEDLQDSCTIGRKAQDTAIGILIDHGFVEKSVFGVPPKRYFSIRAEVILELLISPKETNHIVLKAQIDLSESPLCYSDLFRKHANKPKDGKSTINVHSLCKALDIDVVQLETFIRDNLAELYHDGVFLQKITEIIMLEQTHLTLDQLQRLWDLQVKKKPKKQTQPIQQVTPPKPVQQQQPQQQVVKDLPKPLEEWLDIKAFVDKCSADESILRKLNRYAFNVENIDFQDLYYKMKAYYEDKHFKSINQVLLSANTFLDSIEKCQQFHVVQYYQFLTTFPSFDDYVKVFPKSNVSEYNNARKAIGMQRLKYDELIAKCEEHNVQKPNNNIRYDL